MTYQPTEGGSFIVPFLPEGGSPKMNGNYSLEKKETEKSVDPLKSN